MRKLRIVIELFMYSNLVLLGSHQLMLFSRLLRVARKQVQQLDRVLEGKIPL